MSVSWLYLYDKRICGGYERNHYQEYICGEYKEGRYAWILEDIKALEEPILSKGHLGIWNYLIEQKNKY